MSRGERLFGPKRNTRRNKREYRRERNEARKAKRIESEIESERDNRWERLHSEGSSGSRGIREEATEIYSDPVHRVGDLVMILKDTRPGVSFKSSYDKEGRVIEAIDGKGSGPNLYVVKLLHEHGTEKVDELWLAPIDYRGSVMSTRGKKGTKRYLDNKNVVISDFTLVVS